MILIWRPRLVQTVRFNLTSTTIIIYLIGTLSPFVGRDLLHVQLAQGFPTIGKQPKPKKRLKQNA